MSVKPTKAASQLSQKGEEPTPHQLISLLMAGMLERVNQAQKSILEGNDEDKEILLGKILAILNGLRSSLNFNTGGKIAHNLDALYVYMIERIYEAESPTQEHSALDEVAKLVEEVKAGWDEMRPEQEAIPA